MVAARRHPAPAQPSRPLRVTARLSEAALIALITAYAMEVHSEDWQGRTIDPNAELTDFGLDSIDVVLLTSELEDEFGIDLDPAFFLRHTTIRSIMVELRQMDLAD